jgi:hypothetical protein
MPLRQYRQCQRTRTTCTTQRLERKLWWIHKKQRFKATAVLILRIRCEENLLLLPPTQTKRPFEYWSSMNVEETAFQSHFRPDFRYQMRRKPSISHTNTD